MATNRQQSVAAEEAEEEEEEERCGTGNETPWVTRI
jgi:hypothetical protein